jgi:ribosomal protein S12 methylthiotransferase
MIVYLNSLGCVRNLVDSEVMLGALAEAGYKITQDPSKADIIIVNTCSFIEPAVEESIDTILTLAAHKKTGRCRRLIVTGCLPERFRKAIVKPLPEVDAFLGTGAFSSICEAAGGAIGNGKCLLPPPESQPLQQWNTARIYSNPHLRYLKVSEGCDRHCTYCIIPKLKGRLRSRPMEDVVVEAKNLISSGCKEIVIIGQDTFSYGRDLGSGVTLSRLLDAVADLSDKVWIRCLYGSPDMADDALIRTVAAHDNICPYFDIPVQHASKKILKRMGRPYDKNHLLKLFDHIRSALPNAALRTTLIVGFPGETDKDFKELLTFTEKLAFDHLGVFIYSDIEGVPSHALDGHVPARVTKSRHDALMALQAEISLRHNQNRIGQSFSVLVEERINGDLYAGRTYFQAPEVDGITYVEAKGLKTGAFARVKITEAFEYDLKGRTR